MIQARWRSFFRSITIQLVVISLGLVLFGGLAAAYPTGTYGSGSYGSCQYNANCSISLTSDGTVSLNVAPTAGGNCTIQSDSAQVLTDDTNGYSLTLADSGTDTALVNGTAKINTTSGTTTSPTTLSGNSWGFRVDSLGGFGSGPTTAQSNVARDATLFAGVPPSDQTASTIATVSGAADPAITTTVWFGACANTSAASGAYTTQVIYTAVAN